MTTTQTPSCSCHVQTSSPVDQVTQQASDQPPEFAEWPVYMVCVPTDWEPKSGSALPPDAKRFNNGRVAVEVATMLNREILKQSTDGFVQSWYIRISRGSERQGVVSVSIPAYLGWKPADEHDRPPAQVTIKGLLADARREVAAMNQALSDDHYKGHRFYLGFSISVVPEWAQESQKPETVEADPVSKQDAKPEQQKSVKSSGPVDGAWVYLIDVPCDYNEFSWKSLPKVDGFKRRKNCRLAMIEALQANQLIYDRAKARPVRVWYVVVKVSGGYGIVQIKGDFCPRDAYDMPQPFITTSQHIKTVKELNTILDRGTYTKGRKRAYVAVQFDRLVNFRESRVDELKPEPKPEPQAVPQTVPADQNGHTVTVSGVRAVSGDCQPLTAVDLLKRHGLEIHQVNVDQQKKRLERFLSEMK